MSLKETELPTAPWECGGGGDCAHCIITSCRRNMNLKELKFSKKLKEMAVKRFLC